MMNWPAREPALAVSSMRLNNFKGSTLALGLALVSLPAGFTQAQNRNVSGCLSITDVNERVNCLEGHAPTPTPSSPGSSLDQRQSRVIPSFDCRIAASSIERAICGDDELAGSDSRMGQAYQRAMRVAKDGSALRDNQRLWLIQRDRVCGTTSVILFSCISEMTKRRTSELSSWSSAVIETPLQSSQATPKPPEAKTPSVATTQWDGAPKDSPGTSNSPSKSEPTGSQGQGGGLVAALVAIGAAWLGFKVLRNINRKRALARRREELIGKYGLEVAEAVIAGKVWQGMSEPQLLDSWGSPVEVGREVVRDKVKETWKYGQTGKNRFLNRVYLENGIVIGWKN